MEETYLSRAQIERLLRERDAEFKDRFGQLVADVMSFPPEVAIEVARDPHTNRLRIVDGEPMWAFVRERMAESSIQTRRALLDTVFHPPYPDPW